MLNPLFLREMSEWPAIIGKVGEDDCHCACSSGYLSWSTADQAGYSAEERGGIEARYRINPGHIRERDRLGNLQDRNRKTRQQLQTHIRQNTIVLVKLNS